MIHPLPPPPVEQGFRLTPKRNCLACCSTDFIYSGLSFQEIYVCNTKSKFGMTQGISTSGLFNKILFSCACFNKITVTSEGVLERYDSNDRDLTNRVLCIELLSEYHLTR